MGFLTQDRTRAVEASDAFRPPPPRGSPHSVALPGTKKEGRSAIYRHWRFQDKLLESLDPAVIVNLVPSIGPTLTFIRSKLRMIFSSQQVSMAYSALHFTNIIPANQFPKSKCLGSRPYDPVTKSFGQYQWQDYQTVQKRRAALGSALVELHREAGIIDAHFGVGLWCQNRPEWQITGQSQTRSGAV